VRGNGGGDGADRWGPCVRERRKKIEGVPVRGFGWAAVVGLDWADSVQIFLFSFFFFFLFILFCFTNSLITFANMLQINSNQFLIFSKIQINNAE
jgi:hypothetical protein